MKKLIANGAKKIFQICKAFRNPQELDPLHNPEFTILEWYRVNATYTDLMLDCENLINFIFKKLKQKFQIKKTKLKKFINYQNTWIDIAPPWPRITLKEAFSEFANVNLDDFLNLKNAKEIAQKKGYQVEKDTTWEQIYHQVFLNEVEPKLPKDKPVILYDYPAQLAEGAKLKDLNPKYAERFEFYIGGLELGNGYTELTDWREQEKRFKIALAERKRLKIKVFDYDHDFIKVLKKGLPSCTGMAVGVDRLIMLFTNAKTIKQVIPFPAKEIFSS
jgi:elongation factor P--beta-lysine ligase